MVMMLSSLLVLPIWPKHWNPNISHSFHFINRKNESNGFSMHNGGVGVPVFWPDWQDQKTRQHHNHFGILGSSRLGSGEGSLHKAKNEYIFESSSWDIRLVMKHKGGFKWFGWFLGWSEIINWEGYGMKGAKQLDVSIKNDALECLTLDYGVMKMDYLHTTKQGFP